MEQVNAIRTHPLFVRHMEQNAASEDGRLFCKHDLAHALDVARIGHIINLEEDLGLPKELIYAAALLHDITKWKQHEDGTPHNESAIEPTLQILLDCGFSDTEIASICNAIRQHRKPPEDDTALSHVLYHGDKRSRPCYLCAVTAECKIGRDERNQLLSY